jgi:Transglutaminase-like superfamily
MSRGTAPRLSLTARVKLALRIWRSYAGIRRSLKSTPLAGLTRQLGAARATKRHHPPELLGYAVGRCLRIGDHQVRCLIGSLVLYRLLREQGDEAVLVIGLPPNAVDQTAHAWVELDGRDVGPPPGRGRHVALARFS